jgi:hypothetical protein
MSDAWNIARSYGNPARRRSSQPATVGVNPRPGCTWTSFTSLSSQFFGHAMDDDKALSTRGILDGPTPIVGAPHSHTERQDPIRSDTPLPMELDSRAK